MSEPWQSPSTGKRGRHCKRGSGEREGKGTHHRRSSQLDTGHCTATTGGWRRCRTSHQSRALARRNPRSSTSRVGTPRRCRWWSPKGSTSPQHTARCTATWAAQGWTQTCIATGKQPSLRKGQRSPLTSRSSGQKQKATRHGNKVLGRRTGQRHRLGKCLPPAGSTGPRGTGWCRWGSRRDRSCPRGTGRATPRWSRPGRRTPPDFARRTSQGATAHTHRTRVGRAHQGEGEPMPPGETRNTRCNVVRTWQLPVHSGRERPVEEP